MRRLVTLAVIIVTLVTSFGCSKGNNPFMPGNPDTSPKAQKNVSGSQTHLWGYYDVYLDLDTKTVVAALNRAAMYSANVVEFTNMSPKNLGFEILNTVTGAGYVDIDIDVSLKHPFPGQTQYNGYDVRGIFVANGSQHMKYVSSLTFAKTGFDQMMLDDPNVGDVGGDQPGGGPDGYTRWFNPGDFALSGIFGYTKGMFASPGYTATAKLNPYKYFADGIGKNDSAFGFLTSTSGHGVFSAGMTNTRNYYLRFPIPNPGISFSYAVAANWQSVDPVDHPANAPEAMACSVNVTPDIFYVNSASNGGDLKLDIDIFDWDSHPSAGIMEDYKLIVESNVLTANHTFDTAEMTPAGGGNTWSTYHVEIPADKVESVSGNEFWVIVEDQNNTYTNEFDAPHNCGDAKLAAFFRYDLPVSDTAFNQLPVVDTGIAGESSPKLNTVHDYTVTAHDPDPGDTLTYAWTLKNYPSGTVVTSYDGIAGDPPGTLSINWGSVPGAGYDKSFLLTCTVTDGKSDPIPAPDDMIITLGNNPPVVSGGVSGNASPTLALTPVYYVTASDPDSDPLTCAWTVKNHADGTIVPGFDAIPGNPVLFLSIKWADVDSVAVGKQYDISCTVTDGKSSPEPAPVVLLVTIANQGPSASFTIDPYDPYDWSSVSVTFHSTSTDPDPGETSTLTYEWDFNNDGTFGGTGDTIDSGTSKDPVHIFTTYVNYPVKLKVTDIHGSSDTYASSNLNISIPSCGILDLPSSFVWSTSQSITGASLIDTRSAPFVTRAAVSTKLIIPISTNQFGEVDAGTYGSLVSSGTNSGGQINRAVINSSDRIIYSDAGDNRQLYYVDYSSTGFGTMHNSFGNQIPKLTGNNPVTGVYRMAITGSDEPIIMIPYSISSVNTPRIYIGSSSGNNWGSAISLPGDILTAIGNSWSNYSTYITDMDYDPASDSILITTSYGGNEGIFALDRTGALRWKITDIWTGKTGTYKVGVEVPKTDSECRIVLFCGDGSTGAVASVARCNPNGGGLVTADFAGTYDINIGYSACLIPPTGSVTTWRFFGGASGYGNAYFAYLNMPSDF